MNNLKDEIIERLFKHGCVKFGEFTLKSGETSPFYIDLRRIMSFPELMHFVTKAYKKLAKHVTYDSIAGIPTAALPFAATLSYKVNRPMIYPRIPKKPHGTGNVIEGHYNEGDVVLLLDDLITRGTSKQEALEILREQKLQVKDLIVLIRRGEQATKEMKDLGVKLHYFLDIKDIVNFGRHSGFISDEQNKKVEEFLQK